MTDGEHIEYYENGEIYSKYNCIDGKLDGEYIFYYKNGLIYYKSYYINGKLNDEFITYYESGNISYKQNYLDDKKNGECICYDIDNDNEITNKCYYIYDIEVSEIYWTSYNRNKKLELLGL